MLNKVCVSMIKALNISKRLGHCSILENFSINVEKGSVYGLIGLSEAEKTMILHILSGVDAPDSGEVLLDNEPVYENLAVKKKLAYMGKEFFFGVANTAENVSCYYSNLYENWSFTRFRGLIGGFDIDPKIKVKNLSDKEKKLFAFSLAIAAQTEVVLFDEPFKELDRPTREQMWKIISEEVQNRNLTALISSNSVRDLEKVCTNIGVIADGKSVLEKSLCDIRSTTHKLQIVFDGSLPADLINKLQPLHQTTYGSVAVLIVHGNEQAVSNICKQYAPYICDILPLSIKEIFIYELGGLGYDFENIIL